jgi:hypothetical protein
MPRTALLALAVVASVVAAPSIGEACSKRHQSMFELFDRASTVADVVVRRVPPGGRAGAGPVALDVRRVLKGARRRTLTTSETNTSCHVGFRPGKQALVFLDARGEIIGHFEGYVEDAKRWRPILDAWSAAGDDAARAALLVDAIAGADREVAFDAGFYLADRPGLIDRVDAAARARLIAAAKTAPSHTMLPYVLVRLRAPTRGERHLRELLAVTAFERVTDPDALADAIAGAKGEWDAKAAAALERCERVRGRTLFELTSYIAGVAKQMWPRLAAACRTGTPIAL